MSPYKDLIIDHWRNPRNKGTLPDPDVDVTEANVLCGDVVRLQLKVRNGAVEDVRFDGRGCAISMAAASLLTEMIKGKRLEKIRQMREEELLNALGGVIKPRLKCALLPYFALKKALDQLEAK
ncbi:MAG TPA: SUF system NifU family Fe-S cluster assembly protein [Candidatus Acetothermia bacterium]|nr:SUF system NifU family Fe-S cluster assembly protein [Candidatus Acetothermia bacterium]